MATNDKTAQAYRVASKYSTLEYANMGYLRKWETTGRRPAPILLGEDGHYIIPVTNGHAKLLVAAGLERAL